MIAQRHIPETADRPARDIWIALMFILELGRWKPLSAHATPFEAGRACVRAFQRTWFDMQEQARMLRALTEHPDVVEFTGDSVDGPMLGNAARELCLLMEAQEPSVLKLLDEPRPDDDVTVDGDFIEEATSDDMQGLDENLEAYLSVFMLRLLARVEEAPQSVASMLYQVLETTPTKLPIQLLTLSAELAYPSRSLANAWQKPLRAFMRQVYRLRAAAAALDEQPVGSYLDFCARIIAESQDTQAIALRLLHRCKPSEMTWEDYLSNLSDEPIEELDDHTIVHFGAHDIAVDVEPMRELQNMARMIIEQQRQPDEHGPNKVVSLMFLEPRLSDAPGPLPQDIADDLFVRAVRSAVTRVHQHQGTLISESAIERAAYVASQTLRELTARAGVVQEPIEDESTPIMQRADSQVGDIGSAADHRDSLPEPDSTE